MVCVFLNFHGGISFALEVIAGFRLVRSLSEATCRVTAANQSRDICLANTCVSSRVKRSRLLGPHRITGAVRLTSCSPDSRLPCSQ